MGWRKARDSDFKEAKNLIGGTVIAIDRYGTNRSDYEADEIMIKATNGKLFRIRGQWYLNHAILKIEVST